ncbi:MAG TPA: TolC family protein, partial [Burkholderiales bacterium]|nr:TolC family protein [Burkholderiales bacterium]
MKKPVFLGISMITCLLSGCAVGPDFRPPEAPHATSYSPSGRLPARTDSAPVPGGKAQNFDVKAKIPFDWWTLFRSPGIDSLIQQAFRASPGIEAAQAALRQAQENVVAQEGFFYPTIGASYSPSRNKLAGNMGGNSPGVQGNGSVIQTYSNPSGPPPFNAP